YYTLAQGLLIGAGSAATFATLLEHTLLWIVRRSGITVAIFASGNYLAGSVWPPIVEHFIRTVGWRQTYLGIAVFCAASMLPLALLLRKRPPLTDEADLTVPARTRSPQSLGLT